MDEMAELYRARDELRKSRIEATAKFNAKIEELDRQIDQLSHEFGLKQCPKWAAASHEQRSYWAFMGYDPDNPDVPTD